MQKNLLFILIFIIVINFVYCDNKIYIFNKKNGGYIYDAVAIHKLENNSWKILGDIGYPQLQSTPEYYEKYFKNNSNIIYYGVNMVIPEEYLYNCGKELKYKYENILLNIVCSSKKFDNIILELFVINLNKINLILDKHEQYKMTSFYLPKEILTYEYFKSNGFLMWNKTDYQKYYRNHTKIFSCFFGIFC